jgi:hypothetical protein
VTAKNTSTKAEKQQRRECRDLPRAEKQQRSEWYTYTVHDEHQSSSPRVLDFLVQSCKFLLNAPYPDTTFRCDMFLP